jgi:hypothetical protein
MKTALVTTASIFLIAVSVRGAKPKTHGVLVPKDTFIEWTQSTPKLSVSKTASGKPLKVASQKFEMVNCESELNCLPVYGVQGDGQAAAYQVRTKKGNLYWLRSDLFRFQSEK